MLKVVMGMYGRAGAALGVVDRFAAVGKHGPGRLPITAQLRGRHRLRCNGSLSPNRQSHPLPFWTNGFRCLWLQRVIFRMGDLWARSYNWPTLFSVDLSMARTL